MRTSKHHHELVNGKGKCSAPMWINGMPSGFCGKPAFGDYFDSKRTADGNRIDGKFGGYVPGLACPDHGGPQCPGIEIENGVWSGCTAHKTGAKDCPTCGEAQEGGE